MGEGQGEGSEVSPSVSRSDPPPRRDVEPDDDAPAETTDDGRPLTAPMPHPAALDPLGPLDPPPVSGPPAPAPLADAPGETAAETAEPAEAVRPLGGLGPWLRVVGGAVLFALALRVLAFEAYRIPSTSMEDTLLVGDFVLVSKVHYGPRVLGRRLPGVGEPRRGDVVVFNYPPSLDPDVARRTPYIKRVVGLPGDTLAIFDKEVVVGSEAVPAPLRGRQLWEVEGRLPSSEALDSLGLAGRVQRAGRAVWVASATAGQAAGLDRLAGVAVTPYLRPPDDGSAAFPAARRYSLDDYGPVVVPRRGQRVFLDDLTWPVVRTVIERYEGHTAERTADGFLIDGRPTDSYTFAQDYYFALGDSRDDSADSRTWGFVPFDHVIGKAVGVYFSWDAEAGEPRWGRIGGGVSE